MNNPTITKKLFDILPERTQEHLRGFSDYIYSERTRSTYFALLYRFVLSEGKDLLDVSSGYLEGYVRRQVTSGVKPQTIRTTVNSLRSFFNYVNDHDDQFNHPTKRFRLRIPKTIGEESLSIQKKLVTPEQIQTIFERIRKEEAITSKEVLGSFLMTFLLNSGLRIFEAVSLDIFSPSKDSLTYHNFLRLDGERAQIRVLGKARKLREFCLSDQFSKILVERFKNTKPGTPVFLNSWGTKRLSRFSAHYQIKRLQERFFKDMNLHAFGLHALRHSTIGHLLGERGEHPIHVARLCGNSPEILSRYYLHDTKEILKDVTLAF